VYIVFICFFFILCHRADHRNSASVWVQAIYLAMRNNWPFSRSPGPLYQNEVKCSAFDMEMVFHSHANKTHFHNKGCALGLFFKVRAFGSRKWPIVLSCFCLR